MVSSGRFAVAVRMVTFNVHAKGRTGMASGGKKKTTFAKMAREQKLRERRRDKQAKKDARRQATEIAAPSSSDTTPAAGRDR